MATIFLKKTARIILWTLLGLLLQPDLTAADESIRPANLEEIELTVPPGGLKLATDPIQTEKKSTKKKSVLPIQPIHFTAECLSGQHYRIVAVGDILLHTHLQQQAAASGSFTELWHHFTPYFQQADIAYANLEGPTANGVNQHGRDVPDPGPVFDKVVYTNYPQFNYPPRLLDDLVASGFDLVSTGNNHALDRGELGIDRTIDALKTAKLQYTGTRRSDHNEIPQPWHTKISRNGLTTAWIACTYDTNGLPDRKQQVLHCYKQTDEIKQLIGELKNQVDAILITPHWGWENSITLQPEQIAFAKEMLDNGALAILGSHPHTPQPMEKYLTKDGRETFILYSLGNFVNGQRLTTQKTAIILLLDLIKTETRVVIEQVSFIPAFMTKTLEAWTLLPLQPEGEHPGLTHLDKILPTQNRVFANPEKVVNQPIKQCPPVTTATTNNNPPTPAIAP